ncbi:succinate dehydrogenase assembly factor 2 [Pseudoxanthomonas winnipegensis]|uniref:FAD assembly factor SdhE n=1 Tax=Pseudoxanthomonas winnipegensis TaxID=2480810 RepID=A0A4Q8M8X2_9GAMM|nr:succinate dehydrogenase assembly factor 2 [Pseudoxanthomonas winnipegensis]TAA46420.1 succinate dehydrogenase assembly factor 2 family protein [Pseudoxanthomonas winnipegensis]
MSDASDPTFDPVIKRLRWRSRRGMRELDQLFERYLDHAWQDDSEGQRAVFLALLECEDDKLWRWFMGYEDCPDAALAQLMERIRQLPA